MKVCAITGHRPSRFSFKNNEYDTMCKRLKKKIKKELKYLYKRGVRTFWIGGAEGVDMWSAEILIQLKSYEAYRDIKIMLAIPFEEYNKNWTKKSKERLKNIIKHSEKVVVVNSEEQPKEKQYRKRNEYMIEKADCLLAVFNKDKITARSGTNMTAQFALKKQIPIIVIDCAFCNKFVP